MQFLWREKSSCWVHRRKEEIILGSSPQLPLLQLPMSSLEDAGAMGFAWCQGFCPGAPEVSVRLGGSRGGGFGVCAVS